MVVAGEAFLLKEIEPVPSLFAKKESPSSPASFIWKW